MSAAWARPLDWGEVPVWPLEMDNLVPGVNTVLGIGQAG